MNNVMVNLKFITYVLRCGLPFFASALDQLQLTVVFRPHYDRKWLFQVFS